MSTNTLKEFIADMQELYQDGYLSKYDYEWIMASLRVRTTDITPETRRELGRAVMRILDRVFAQVL
jgi:hypothetical protein